MTDFENNTWKCPVCGNENKGMFCTECGAAKPAQPETETPAAAEPAETAVKAAPKPAEPVKEAEKPAPQSAPVSETKQAAPVKRSHPFLTALMAAVLGLGGGYGGSILAMRTYLPQTETAAAEEAPAEETVTEETAQPQENTAEPVPVSAASVSIQDVAETASKTVVEIQTENTVTSYGLFGGTYTSTAAGSGVIITGDGYIITNNHVVEGSRKITVKTYNGKKATCKVTVKQPATQITLDTYRVNLTVGKTFKLDVESNAKGFYLDNNSFNGFMVAQKDVEEIEFNFTRRGSSKRSAAKAKFKTDTTNIPYKLVKR